PTAVLAEAGRHHAVYEPVSPSRAKPAVVLSP
ncbi:MAG: hypothetical protein QOK43_1168, partial [Acidimicrobiaceae bacterium]|nr:hypothetical protein [Acidimicrobiaceae bacterium]